MDQLWGALPYILLFLFFFVAPAIARRRHAEEVERRFAQVQRKRKSRIIAIVHRQEAMGLLGIPNLRYIDLNDAEDVLAAIRSTPPDRPLELILHTPGGLILPALQIARAVKAHPGPVRVFVPHYAMSGGTLIALAADEIFLNSHAVLGPIDPQIGGIPAASIAAVVAAKSPDATDDYTLILNDVAQKAQVQLERAAKELLRGTVSDNAAAAVAGQLSSGRWTHDYPIDAAEASGMGLPVRTDLPAEIAEILALFPDRLSGRSVKYTRIDAAALFGRRRQAPPRAPLAGTGAEAGGRVDEARFSFTGYQPGPGARSFSYGPWAQSAPFDGEQRGPHRRPPRR